MVLSLGFLIVDIDTFGRLLHKSKILFLESATVAFTLSKINQAFEPEMRKNACPALVASLMTNTIRGVDV